MSEKIFVMDWVVRYSRTELAKEFDISENDLAILDDDELSSIAQFIEQGTFFAWIKKEIPSHIKKSIAQKKQDE